MASTPNFSFAGQSGGFASSVNAGLRPVRRPAARGTAPTGSGRPGTLQGASDGSGSTHENVARTSASCGDKRVLVRRILDLADELPPGRVNGRALTDRIAYALGVDEALVDDTINQDRKANRSGLSMALVGMDGVKAEVRAAMRDAAEEIYAGHGERGPRRGMGRAE